MRNIDTGTDPRTAETSNPLECLVIRDLLINDDNHATHDSAAAQPWSPGWNDAMKAFSDVNAVLDELLGGNEHGWWGCRYAAFLGDFNFDWQTENGWWGIPAIDKDNLKAFVKAMTDENFLLKCQKAQIFIEKTGAMFGEQNVLKIVEAFNV